MAEVLVTGASGFLAGHCVTELLSHGHAVRGTVRPPLARARVDHLRAAGGELEFVEADLLDDAGWAAALDGVDAVLHTASPFPATLPRDEDELIRPAVDGTLRVLRAAVAAGVRRVVLTSSIASVNSGYPRGDDRVRTEADWSDVEHSSPYAKSKTLAERAAWEFAAGHPELELVAVNPGLVIGPVQRASTGTSVEILKRLVNGEVPVVPKLGLAPVDVRDVAVAHRLALETPEAAGQRYICAGAAVGLPEVAAILAPEFTPRGFRIPTRTVPDWLFLAVARFDSSLRPGAELVGRMPHLSSAKAETELGWKGRPLRESLLDTAEALIEHGLVRPRGKTG